MFVGGGYLQAGEMGLDATLEEEDMHALRYVCNVHRVVVWNLLLHPCFILAC